MAIAGAGRAATNYSIGGWDLDSLESECAFYGTVGRHMDTIAELVYTSKDQDVQLRALAVMEMYPGLWRTTLPHLVTLFRDVAHQAPAVRVAALAAMSYVAPIPWRRNDADNSDHEEPDAFLQTIRLLGLFLPLSGVKPLKSLVAFALAERGASTRSKEQLAGLPEELQSFLMSLGISTHPNDTAAFPRFQTRAAEGVCRLVFRARGWTHSRHTFVHAPPQPPIELPKAEEKLLPLLPGALHVLRKSQCRVGPSTYLAYLARHRQNQLPEAQEEEEENDDDDDEGWIEEGEPSDLVESAW